MPACREVQRAHRCAFAQHVGGVAALSLFLSRLTYGHIGGDGLHERFSHDLWLGGRHGVSSGVGVSGESDDAATAALLGR